MAHALSFTRAMCVVNWEEDWVVGQFARSDTSSMWLFARAKGAMEGSFRVATVRELSDFALLCGAINPSECYAITNFLEGDLNEAATAADASRDTIWQGNCDLADLQLRRNIAPIRNTIPIQYPLSNCPANVGGFLPVAVSKARRAAVSPTPPPDFRRRASDTH